MQSNQVMLFAGNIQGILETGIQEIGNQEGYAFLLHNIVEVFQRLGNIGSGLCGMEIVYLRNNPQDMRFPFLGRNEFLYLIAKKNDPYLVIVRDGRKSKNPAYLGYD